MELNKKGNINSGLNIRNYLSEFLELDQKILEKLIKKYKIETNGLEIDKIKEIIVKIFNRFKERGYNFNNFINTCIVRKGENIPNDLNINYGLNLSEEELIAFGLVIYFFEEEEYGTLEGYTQKFAGDIISNL